MIKDFSYDSVWWMLYDKAHITAGRIPRRIRLMSGILNEEKGLESTNLYIPNALPAPCWFQVKGFSIFRAPMSNKDAYNKILGEIGLQLWVGQKTYFDAPGAMFTTEHGVEDFMELINKGVFRDRLTNEEKHGIIIPLSGAVEFPKGFELSIPYGMSFSLDLICNSGASITDAVDVFGAIWGINHRGVQ